MNDGSHNYFSYLLNNNFVSFFRLLTNIYNESFTIVLLKSLSISLSHFQLSLFHFPYTFQWHYILLIFQEFPQMTYYAIILIKFHVYA